MKDVTDWEIQVLDFAERPRLIADRPVDLNDANWLAKLKQAPPPLDEAGVRSETEALLEDIVDEYQTSGEDTRQAIRKFFERYRAFSWAATLPFAPTTDEYFRRHLVLFSIKDQGRDARVAILSLQALCHTANAAAVSTRSILREVAELSSDEDKYQMGSTKRLLLNATLGARTTSAP
jgi:hypothetical protein